MKKYLYFIKTFFTKNKGCNNCLHLESEHYNYCELFEAVVNKKEGCLFKELIK